MSGRLSNGQRNFINSGGGIGNFTTGILLVAQNSLTSVWKRALSVLRLVDMHWPAANLREAL